MAAMSFNRRVLLFSAPPAIQSAVSFALLPLMTLVLGPADYGAFALVTAVTSFGTALCTLGAGFVLAQRWPEADADTRRALVSSLFGLSVVLACLFALLMPWLWQLAAAQWTVAASVPETAIRLAAAGVFFAVPWLIASEVLTLDGRALAFAVVMLTQTVCAAAASLTALFYFDLGGVALFAGAFAAAAATGIGACVCLAPWLRLRFDRALAIHSAGMGLPLSLSNLLDIATTLTERALLSTQVGLANLGIYSHSQSYLNIAQAGIKPLVRAVWPVSLSEARDSASPFTRTGQAWSVGHLLLIGAGLLMAAFGRDLIGLLTHGKFEAAGPFAALWMGLLLVRLSGRPQLATLFANGRGYAISKIGIVANGTAIAVLLLLVPRIGLAGAVAAAFIQAAMTRAMFWWAARQERDTPFQDGWVLAGVALIAGAVALVESTAPSAGLRALGLAAALTLVAIAGRRPLGELRLQLKRGWS